jgi:DNA-binding MarR family transcriptional regulator
MTDTKNTSDARTVQIQAITSHLRILFKSIQQHSKIVEKECGLTSAMLWMMWELFASPGMKVSELAKALSIHASTCSNMLDKLEAKGLIERERSGEDQRAVHLYITDAGSTLLAKAPRPAQGALSGTLEKLADDDLHKLADGLQVLVGSLQTKEDDAEYTPIFEE